MPNTAMTARNRSYWSILMLSYVRIIICDSQCYFPDGSIPVTLSGEPDYQPCNVTTANKASPCCQLSTSTCTTTGYCNLNNGYTYRGACTDPSFPQPCAQGCLNVSISAYSPIFPCDNPGNYASTWCCGITILENGTPVTQGSCCSQNFTNFTFGTPFVPAAVIETPISISSTTAPSSDASATRSIPFSASEGTTRNAIFCSTTATVSHSATTKSSSPSSRPAAIGAGLGAASGFTLLLGFAFLFYREYKRRVELENVIIGASYGRVP